LHARRDALVGEVPRLPARVRGGAGAYAHDPGGRTPRSESDSDYAVVESAGVLIGFLLTSGLTVGAALAVLLSRNLLHAVIFLVLSFLGMAGLFLTLSADFIAMAQVLIYGGAIPVLLVFAVMLTPFASRDNGNSMFAIPGTLIGLGFA